MAYPFVEQVSGDRIQVRITDTEGQMPIIKIRGYARILVCGTVLAVGKFAVEETKNMYFRYMVVIVALVTVGQTKAEAFEESSDLAPIGNAKALYQMCLSNAFGLGVPYDWQKAISWCQKAADKGNAKGQVFMGRIYASGNGLREDQKRAAAWFQKAANQGDKEAEYELGLMYKRGKGVLQDQNKAAVLFQKAANKGNAYAQYELGLAFEFGNGVPVNYKKAAEWFQKAAHSGSADGQVFMGETYLKGNGVPQDDKKAAEWFQKAADQDNSEGQFAIGYMYEKGEGVTRDNQRAYYWYLRAKKNGYSLPLDELLKTVAAKLTFQQRLETEVQVENLKPVNRLLKYSPPSLPSCRLAKTIEAHPTDEIEERATHARSRHLHREPVHHAPPR